MGLMLSIIVGTLCFGAAAGHLIASREPAGRWGRLWNGAPDRIAKAGLTQRHLVQRGRWLAATYALLGLQSALQGAKELWPATRDLLFPIQWVCLGLGAICAVIALVVTARNRLPSDPSAKPPGTN